MMQHSEQECYVIDQVKAWFHDRGIPDMPVFASILSIPDTSQLMRKNLLAIVGVPWDFTFGMESDVMYYPVELPAEYQINDHYAIYEDYGTQFKLPDHPISAKSNSFEFTNDEIRSACVELCETAWEKNAPVYEEMARLFAAGGRVLFNESFRGHAWMTLS